MIDRRAVFGQVAAGAAAVTALPQLALADGAVSAGTIAKARAVYGGRIYDLKDAVEKGDFGKIAEEKNAFVLFNSGAYPSAKSKKQKQEAIKQTNDIFAAVKNKDKAALKKAFDNYIASNEIKGFPVVENANKGQGYSSEFDYRARTKAGTVYIR